MKYYFVSYTTIDGEHEYAENAVFSASNEKEAQKTAVKGEKLFQRYGWEEFCKLSNYHEIPKDHYKILKEYFNNLNDKVNQSIINNRE